MCGDSVVRRFIAAWSVILLALGCSTEAVRGLSSSGRSPSGLLSVPGRLNINSREIDYHMIRQPLLVLLLLNHG